MGLSGWRHSGELAEKELLSSDQFTQLTPIVQMLLYGLVIFLKKNQIIV